MMLFPGKNGAIGAQANRATVPRHGGIGQAKVLAQANRKKAQSGG